jgi:hypothetical protein
MNTSSSSSSSGNMIQNKSKPLHPSNHSTQIIKDEDVSEQNLRDLLASQSRSAAFQCPMVNKKQLLEPIFNNHKVIINTVTNIDNDNSDTSILTHLKNELLYSSSESTSPSKLWKRLNNAQLATKMIKLFSIFKIAYKNRKFRQLQKYTSALMTKMEEAQSICKEKKQDEAEPCALLKGLKRTTEQLSRKFLEGVGTKCPDDLLLALCAFCGH